MAQAIRKLEDEVASLKPALSDYRNVCTPIRFLYRVDPLLVLWHGFLTTSRMTGSTMIASRAEPRSLQRSLLKPPKTKQRWREMLLSSLSIRQMWRRHWRNRRTAKLQCPATFINSARKSIVSNKSSKTRVTASRRLRTTERRCPETSGSLLWTMPFCKVTWTKSETSALQSSQSTLALPCKAPMRMKKRIPWPPLWGC